MGFSSFDDLISEVSGGKSLFRHFWFRSPGWPAPKTCDLWCTDGYPEPGTFTGTAKTLRQFDDTVPGAILHGGNVAPDTKHLLAAGINAVNCQQAPGTGWITVYDRVATYEACPMSSQSLINTLAPQRYVSAGEPGLRVACLLHAAPAVAVETLSSMDYVNQAGASRHVAFSGNTTPSAYVTPGRTQMQEPAVYPASTYELELPLLPGDTGVRSITSYVCPGSDASGKFTFLLYYPLVCIPFDENTNVFNTGITLDLVRQFASLPRIYDGAHLNVMYTNAGPSAFDHDVSLSGWLQFGWG